jgi:hypothetical protein
VKSFAGEQAVPPTEPAPSAPRPVQIPPRLWAENERAALVVALALLRLARRTK